MKGRDCEPERQKGRRSDEKSKQKGDEDWGTRITKFYAPKSQGSPNKAIFSCAIHIQMTLPALLLLFTGCKQIVLFLIGVQVKYIRQGMCLCSSLIAEFRQNMRPWRKLFHFAGLLPPCRHKTPEWHDCRCFRKTKDSSTVRLLTFQAGLLL